MFHLLSILPIPDLSRLLPQWFAREVQPRLKGRAYVVRYADDFVVGFTDDEGGA